MQLVIHHQRLGPGTLVSLVVLISGCAMAPDIPDAPGTSESGTSEPEPRPATVIAQLPADDLFYGAALGATKAIEAYLKCSDVITSEGDSDPRRMAARVTTTQTKALKVVLGALLALARFCLQTPPCSKGRPW